LVGLLAGGLVVAANQICGCGATERPRQVLRAAHAVGLFLGTSDPTNNGKPNLHFDLRIAAAASLYRSGKVQHLLVSGDSCAAQLPTYS
jgi:vancomycin permeability regulator SanA